MKTLNEVCKIVGLSRRMIQEYESGKNAIAVTPTTKNKYGYLLYNEEQIEHLQTIKFYREAGYSKKQIKEIFDHPSTDSPEILQNAIIGLEKKRNEIDCSIATAELMLRLHTTPNKMSRYFNPDDTYTYRRLKMSSMQKVFSTPNMFISPDNLPENTEKLLIENYMELEKLMNSSIEPYSEKAQYYIEQIRTALYPLISDSIYHFLGVGKSFIIAEADSPELQSFYLYIEKAIIHYCSIHKDDSQFDKYYEQCIENLFNTFDENKVQEAIQTFYNCVKILEGYYNPIQFLKFFADLCSDKLLVECIHTQDEEIWDENDEEWIIQHFNFIRDEIYLFCDTFQNNH